jgi:lipopolysaccharide/colanic/teichoic acid biosynthesis glycosyltransferase
MIKRLFDLISSFLGVIILSPLLTIVSIVVLIKHGPPIIFKQTRPGKESKSFRFYKFRTMTNETDETGNLLPDKDRLTNFGNFLRKTSLDELPSLFNVLKGDMSLVGPRPLLMQYLPLYNEIQKRRHEVKPGITGWAQINGRNALSWQKKFELDVWYVDNQSFWLDLKILFLTFYKVFIREGISAEGEATMKPFTGNQES